MILEGAGLSAIAQRVTESLGVKDCDLAPFPGDNTLVCQSAEFPADCLLCEPEIVPDIHVGHGQADAVRRLAAARRTG